MTEQELEKKIKESAGEVKIPEKISPEGMKQQLGERAKELHRKQRKYSYWRRGGVTAAAIMLCGTAVFAVYKSQGSIGKSAEPAEQGNEAEEMERASGEWEDSAEDIADIAVKESKKNAGEFYTVASDYGEVYEVLRQNKEETTYESKEKLVTGGYESTNERVEDAGALRELSSQDRVLKHSETNLQTKGVDESDIAKTDGSYIYTVNGETVTITDIRDGRMVPAGRIDAAGGNGADRVMEIYVDKDRLSVVTVREDTELTRADAAEDSYSLSSQTVTSLKTYDISDRKNPRLLDTVTQDGFYKTSRKIGNMIYLFTDETIQTPALTKREAANEENAGGWIPLVDGKAVAADCIYLPKQGTDGLLISSVNVNSPGEIVDNALILNNYVDIYVSTNAIYLYGSGDFHNSDSTQIAKFELKNGVIQAVGATAVSGNVRDTFAVNEYGGKLRVLTTDFSGGESENKLYILDENLKLTGKLGGIAKGEEIYAARFLGKTAYFVTYRNTDPLFAVDLSDEKNLKVLSELKITGFSEYLHFWGEDQLVGIGYETDPKTGQQKGLKLTMFDISDPSDLKVNGTCTIKGANYSPALYEYRCVLADAKENLIGFSVMSENGKSSYLLFSWEQEDFKKQLSESVGMGDDLSEYRGMYVGDTFYLVSGSEIISYDRTEQYRRTGELELS